MFDKPQVLADLKTLFTSMPASSDIAAAGITDAVVDNFAGGTIADHGDLDGLSDDDHSQYLNNTRHDATARHTLGTVVPHDDHGSLSGLSDDDHTQYAKLAGRSEGQTLTGGTAASDSLTLTSTSNATKGTIVWGTKAIFDEVNGYLRIGDTTAPTASLEVAGSCVLAHPTASTSLNIASVGAGQGSYIEVKGGGGSNGYAFMDLTGDATYTDYGLRLIRGNGGANTTSQIIHRGTGTMSLIATDAGAMEFKTSNVSRLNIEPGGNVWLGSSISSVIAFHVNANKTSGYAGSFFNDGNSTNRWGIRVQAGADNSAGTNYMGRFFDGDGTEIGQLLNTNGTFSLYSLSDERSKENIHPTKINGLDVVNALAVKEFNYKKNDVKHTAGFIAQDCLKVFPEMVSETPDGMLTIDQTSLIPILIKAIQELNIEVQQLRAKIKE